MASRVDLEEFVAGFLIEADEHLHSVSRNLLAVTRALEAGRAEPRAVRELFRSFHTIKGLSAMVGAEPIVDLSHELEGILRLADRAGGRVHEAALDLLLQGTRAVEERIRAVKQSGIANIPKAPPQLLHALALVQSESHESAERRAVQIELPEDVVRGLSSAEREQLLQATELGQRAVLVEFQPSRERAASGLDITHVRARLAELGALVKVIPRSSPEAPTGIAFWILLVTSADDSTLAQVVGGATEAVRSIGVVEKTPAHVQLSEADAEPEPATGWNGSDDSIRVDVRRLDEALEQLSSLVVTRFKMARVVGELAARGVDTRELDAILADNTRQLRRLRAAITMARMVPLAELLERLPLVVRGLTRDGRKSVNVELRAGSAEVDKAVADKIFPAVLHLVRNAVDHAIEPAEERLRAGKPESGTLTIHCDDSSGTRLMMTVTDDGRGIDRDAVAGRLGLERAQSDDELLQQITTPGLSTRDGVTRTSGRGMGMDIVQRTVQALGGDLRLHTETGRGTTFTLRVPVSITIVDVFSFLAGGQVFVAPVAMVEEILEIEPSRVVEAPAAVKRGPAARLLQRRGRAIPLLGLAALLSEHSEDAISPKALVVHQSRGAIAFGVDRMLGQQEAVVRPLEDGLVRVPGVSGATDLGDGKPILVLDLATLGNSLAQLAVQP